MAVLLQGVVGTWHGCRFYTHISGLAQSYNKMEFISQENMLKETQTRFYAADLENAGFDLRAGRYRCLVKNQGKPDIRLPSLF